MKPRVGVFVVLLVVVFLLAARLSSAQGSSLEADLKSQYKVTRFAVDSSGLVVSDAGVVLSVRKPGVRAFPPAMLILQTTKYQDGRVDTPKENSMLGPNKLLPVDTRVYVMKMSVDVKKDRIILIVVECDSCNGAQQPSFYKAQLAFQFPQGYLQGAEAGQVSDVIAGLLGPDNPDQGGQDQGAQGGQQQAAPAEPPKETQTIDKGQTEDQVVGILGKPDKIVNLGAKKLYIYKDMKITFIGGKVSDVQ